jgi:dipeptidyl aminopeptidase/acylaminoacyl peptidase
MTPSNYNAKTPYLAPPHEEMVRLRRMANIPSAAGYQASIDRLMKVEGIAVSNITYQSDGLKITGVEVLPEFAPGETGPLVIYNRGGSREFGALSPSQIGIFMVPFALSMRAGVLASNYRGSMGGEGEDAFGGDDLHDVAALIEIGRQQPWWDGKNIFMLGWSRGGMMTYLAIKHGMKLNAAMAGAAPADLAANGFMRPEMARLFSEMMAAEGGQEAALKRRSAVHWPEALTVPLLMLHGDKDDRVSVEDTRRLYAQLSDLGREVKYMEFPGGDHYLMNERKAVIDATVAWFEQHRL